jgi:hypothetical protein
LQSITAKIVLFILFCISLSYPLLAQKRLPFISFGHAGKYDLVIKNAKVVDSQPRALSLNQTIHEADIAHRPIIQPVIALSGNCRAIVGS